MKIKLTEATGPQAERCKLAGKRAGSRNIALWEAGPLKIVSSIDPSGLDGRDELHVSVSCRGEPVSNKLAIEIASQLFENGHSWKCSHSDCCTHVHGKD